jgi:hypothetical protein
VTGIDFEGRPLELGDRLLYRKTDAGDPVAVILYAFQFWGDSHEYTSHEYTLREVSGRTGRRPRPKEHRLAIEKLRETCTRDPAERERRR